MGEAGLGLVGADLGVTGRAPPARAASAHKRSRDALADAPVLDARSEVGDGADEFMAGNVGKLNCVVVPGPGMPIAPTQTSGFNVDDDSVSGSRRVRKLGNDGFGLEFLEVDSAHGAIVWRRERSGCLDGAW